jgi:hypothetical protein
VIRDDRELLAELARLNSAMASFALRIMAGERLLRRADGMRGAVIDGGGC